MKKIMYNGGMTMIKKITAYILSICVMCTCVINFTVTASANGYGEYIDGWYHISTADQLKAFAEASQTAGSPVLTSNFVLDNDIELTKDYDEKIHISSKSDVAFKGIFDGNGHKISGLSYSSQAIDTSLFGFTDGATIKNLVIENADIKGINRGGIVAGHANDTDFLNISIENSYLNIASGGQVIELITADGVTAGALAGEAVGGCLIYNCESVNTVVETPDAEGIIAVAGDGYYIGGLVGTLDASHIEYSRVLSEGSADSGKISMETTVAISVLTGRKTYVGGIAGEIKNGATITDCYCNVNLINKPAVAVAVGSFVYGYVGGITGAMYGNKTKVTRCQYSGNAEARDFGGVIIVGATNNKHLGGIVGLVGEDESIDDRITNCYYNYDRIMSDKENAKSSVAWRDGTPSVYYGISPETSSSYSEEQYADQSNWTSKNYDFNGSTLISTACDDLVGGNHVNQWVMKTYNYTNTDDTAYATTTMPVHGITTMKIYSNVNNAFTDTNPVNMSYKYTVNADDTITIPDETDLDAIKPNMENSGFMGVALVSERDNEAGTKVYTCDYMFEAGTDVDRDIIETYIFDSNDKAIYGVWCQAYTLGAQIGLNGGNQGLRVLTAVNTDLLDNIGLSEADVNYGRGATFTVDGNDYIIEADSKEWKGESYITGGSYNGSSISDYVSNARVFSIFLALEDSELDTEITYGGDILCNAADSEGTEVVLDYLCNQVKNSASNIAETYIADLEKSGETADNYYGIGEDAYNNLMEYIA